MIISFNKTAGALSSQGITFSNSGDFEVSKEVGEYLVKTFPANFSTKEVTKGEPKVTPVETKEEPKVEPKVKSK